MATKHMPKVQMKFKCVPAESARRSMASVGITVRQAGSHGWLGGAIVVVVVDVKGESVQCQKLKRNEATK